MAADPPIASRARVTSGAGAARTWPRGNATRTPSSPRGSRAPATASTSWSRTSPRWASRSSRCPARTPASTGRSRSLRRGRARLTRLRPVAPRVAERLRLDGLEHCALAGLYARADGGDGAPRALQRDEPRHDPNRPVLVPQELRLKRGHLLRAGIAQRGVVTDDQRRDEMLDAFAQALQRNLGARELELKERADAEIAPAQHLQFPFGIAGMAA